MKRFFVIGGIGFFCLISLLSVFFIQASSASASNLTEETITYECVTDADCEDYNSCTLDICSKTPGQCLHTRLSGCHTRYGCVGVGSIGILNSSPMYCSSQGNWLDMRVTDSYCKHDYECRSEDCAAGKCVGEEQSFRPMGFWKRLSLSFS